MRALMALTALVLATAQPAAAEDLFADTAPADLEALRGGTETATEINGSVIQTNDTTQSASNNGSISMGADAVKLSGSIREATVTGNHGVTAVMQNTGDLVNMNNSTSVNVFLR